MAAYSDKSVKVVVCGEYCVFCDVSSFQLLLDCLVGKASDHCGKKAGLWLESIMQKVSTPIVTPYCQLTVSKDSK